MLARGILGSEWTCGVSFQPFPNFSSWWWLISSIFFTRISCHKTIHANSYYGAWSGWEVSIRVLPLTKGGVQSFLYLHLSPNFCGNFPGNSALHVVQAEFFLLSQFSSVELLSHVRLFATPWNTARQASLSITNSRSSLKLTSIKSVMPSSHLILCRPLLLLPPIPPSIRVFSNESTLHMRWPK